MTQRISETKERIIVLGEQIGQSSVSRVMEKIFEINRDDDLKQELMMNFERRPITLVINSFGGEVYSGLGLVDLMRNSATPIDTVCYGSAMSMGFILLICGRKRSIGKYSTALYHEVSSMHGGKLTSLKESILQDSIMQDILDGIVLEKTLITKEKLEQVRSGKDDWYITSDDCKKLGIVDEVL